MPDIQPESFVNIAEVTTREKVEIPEVVGGRGPRGRGIELQTTATHLQWRVADATPAAAWQDLIALADLEGQPGAPGEQVEIGVSATHIQWRYVDGAWTDLIDLAALQGEPGGTGPAGTITIGTVTASEPGGAASVENVGTAEAAVLNITLPRGAAGNDGTPATITIGTVTTGEPGTEVIVTNSGTATNAVLDITIPRGADGGGERFAVDIRDHGAVDGAADNTAAIAAARDAAGEGGIVVYPPGLWITDPVAGLNGQEHQVYGTVRLRGQSLATIPVVGTANGVIYFYGTSGSRFSHCGVRLMGGKIDGNRRGMTDIGSAPGGAYDMEGINFKYCDYWYVAGEGEVFDCIETGIDADLSTHGHTSPGILSRDNYGWGFHMSNGATDNTVDGVAINNGFGNNRGGVDQYAGSSPQANRNIYRVKAYNNYRNFRIDGQSAIIDGAVSLGGTNPDIITAELETLDPAPGSSSGGGLDATGTAAGLVPTAQGDDTWEWAASALPDDTGASAGDVLTTDGSGGKSWAPVPGGEGGGSGVVPEGEWSPTQTYDAGDVVTVGNRSYLSLVGSNLANDPTTAAEVGVIDHTGPAIEHGDIGTQDVMVNFLTVTEPVQVKGISAHASPNSTYAGIKLIEITGGFSWDTATPMGSYMGTITSAGVTALFNEGVITLMPGTNYAVLFLMGDGSNDIPRLLAADSTATIMDPSGIEYRVGTGSTSGSNSPKFMEFGLVGDVGGAWGHLAGLPIATDLTDPDDETLPTTQAVADAIAQSGGGGGGFAPDPSAEPDGRMLYTEGGELVYGDAPAGGGGGGAALARSTLTYTTASLVDGAAEDGELDVTLDVAQVLTITADVECRVTVYSSQARADADAVRGITTDPQGDHGMLMDVLVAAGVVLPMSPVPTIYAETGQDVWVRVRNDSGAASTVAVTMTVVRVVG